jgi:hypothetical protein
VRDLLASAFGWTGASSSNLEDQVSGIELLSRDSTGGTVRWPRPGALIESGSARRPAMEASDENGPKRGRASFWPVSTTRVRSAVVAWLVVLVAQLVLIWAYPRIPTQDGPVHVASAIAFRDLGEPGTSYGELFERRLAPFPNWTSHLLLAGLTRLVDPVVAEKLLVSLWLLLWPLGARRLAGAVGADREPVTGAALLLAFGRALWLGFYNFLLGVALALLAVAWMVERRRWRTMRDTVVLAVLFLLLFFTHLGAWALAATIAGTLAAVSKDRSRRLLPLLGGLVPSLALAVLFASREGMAGSAGLRRMLGTLSGAMDRHAPGASGLFSALRLEWFGTHAGLAAGGLTLVTLAILIVLALGSLVAARSGATMPPVRRALLVLGGLAFLAFAFGPADLGARAGYFEARLALVAPVLLLAGASVLPWVALRRGLLVVLVVLNLWSVGGVAVFLSRANRDLSEFTAAADVVGGGKTLFLWSGEDSDRPISYINPNLYCLDTGNAVASNYEAGTRHFPLRYRPGVRKAAREMANRTRPPWTDIVLLWDVPGSPRMPESYVEVYRRGRLRVFARRPGGRSATPEDRGTAPRPAAHAVERMIH